MASKKEEAPEDVRLVVADVDGALVTPDKVLTPRARSAVRKIIGAGNRFYHHQRPASTRHEDADRRSSASGPSHRV